MTESYGVLSNVASNLFDCFITQRVRSHCPLSPAKAVASKPAKTSRQSCYFKFDTPVDQMGIGSITRPGHFCQRLVGKRGEKKTLPVFPLRLTVINFMACKFTNARWCNSIVTSNTANIVFYVYG